MERVSPQIGIGLYSVHAQLTADPVGTLQRLKAIGYQAVEPSRRTGIAPGAVEHLRRILGEQYGLESADVPIGEFAAALSEVGLTVASCLVSLPEGDRAELVFDEQEQLGNSRIVLPSIYNPNRDDIPVEDLSTVDDMLRVADRVNSAAQLARTRGMRLGYHNHAWEAIPDHDGRSRLEAFFELLEPDIFAEVDVYWAQVGGRPPADLIRALGSRVELVHLKDGRAPGEPNVAVGTGVIDIAGVLEEIGGLDTWTVEFDASTDIWADLEASFTYLSDQRAAVTP